MCLIPLYKKKQFLDTMYMYNSVNCQFCFHNLYNPCCLTTFKYRLYRFSILYHLFSQDVFHFETKGIYSTSLSVIQYLRLLKFLEEIYEIAAS